jgi:DNA (cytosine-5)-methyltransferase 1
VERVQGFPVDWTLPRHFDDLQAERINSLRYHAIGNAVTPPVAEWVGGRLLEAFMAKDRAQPQLEIASAV